MARRESPSLDEYGECITTDQYGTLQVDLPKESDRFLVAREFSEAGFDVVLPTRRRRTLILRSITVEAHAFASTWPIYAYMAVRRLRVKRLPPEDYLPEGMLPVYEPDANSESFLWQGKVAFFATSMDQTEKGMVFHVGRTRWCEVGSEGLTPVRVDRWHEEMGLPIAGR